MTGPRQARFILLHRRLHHHARSPLGPTFSVEIFGACGNRWTAQVRALMNAFWASNLLQAASTFRCKLQISSEKKPIWPRRGSQKVEAGSLCIGKRICSSSLSRMNVYIEARLNRRASTPRIEQRTSRSISRKCAPSCISERTIDKMASWHVADATAQR
jgi:hypothetical protein